MSNLDDALDFVAHTDIEWEGDTPREEVAQLRAAAAERDDWRRAMQHLTPLGSEYTTPDECAVYIRSKMNAVTPLRIINAEAECLELHSHLDALYSELAAAIGHELRPGFDAHEAIAQLVERIARQAAQLEQARNAIDAIVSLGKDSHDVGDDVRWREMWHVAVEEVEDRPLANAPAPQEERTA